MKTVLAELVHHRSEQIVQIARLKMMRHPVPHFVQARNEVPGGFIMSSDYSTADTQNLIEG
jgi:hypothetical protein